MNYTSGAQPFLGVPSMAESIRPEQIEEDDDVGPLTVEVEPLVLIKIMRHCRMAFPNAVNGLLIGLERGSTLELTNSFEHVSKQDWATNNNSPNDEKANSEERLAAEEARFHARALEALQATNGDCMNPGWYQTLTMRDMHDTDIVEGLLEFQEHGVHPIVIGYDPTLPSAGVAAFQAFRLPPHALSVLRQHKQNGDDINVGIKELAGRPLLVEVPLIVKSSLLAQAFLIDWLSLNQKAVISEGYEILGRDAQAPLMQLNIEFMGNCLDDLVAEQDTLIRALKDNARASNKHREAIERRRIDNEQRRLKGEPDLPSLPAFQPSTLPSQLPVVFAATNARRAARSVAQIVSDNVCCSYLLPKIGGGGTN